MYNSKEMIVDEDLTFLSYNQSINDRFTVEDLLDSPLWFVDDSNGLIKAIPLFNCDKITSNNSNDKIIDDNKCIILENNNDTIIECISNDTSSIHYYNIFLHAYAPNTFSFIVDVIVYCIVYDEYLNTVNNVEVSVFVDNEYVGVVNTDNKGLCEFNLGREIPHGACTVKFVYNGNESKNIYIG